MSATALPEFDPSVLEQIRRQIKRLAEEITHPVDGKVVPADYYSEFLPRVLAAIAPPAETCDGQLEQIPRAR
jgi:hypothetical protein